ncbi:MAG: serine/threonine protein kinase [Phycisphaeraceae bacterium]|nr:serine/threonine protein kinase [Phycisphaeraceae bacterium]
MPEDDPPGANSGGAAADIDAGVLLGGRYRLLHVLGSGGLGVVWLADQVEPVRRKVAVKLIKPGMDSEQVLHRFEAERNALTLMNHPSIARVYDAGVTDRGRPWFVMEYVPGDPITKFCDRERLDTRERLELFIQACGAVQHAHQKSVIHRDLKPSNILVTMHEGRPLAKVIDFGIAKATGAELTEGTLFTEHGQLIGTPEYMSPEQAEITALGVDSTTDIYSLGVVLYELLTGVLPFDPGTLRSRGFAEIRRIIREEDPPKPSTRLRTLGPATETVGKQRRAEPRSLQRRLRGDLDWITMRAMEKQRARRYPSASELAADVRRHLDNEPVLAGPPSLAYRASKLVRRHRGVVASAALGLVALLLGVVGLGWGVVQARARQAEAVAAHAVAESEAQRARQAEEHAESQRGLAEASAARARAEAQRASLVTDFLLNVLGLADPDVSQSPNTTIQDLLVRAGEEVGPALRGEPRAELAVRLVLTRSLTILGEYEAARQHVERALRLGEELDDLQLAEQERLRQAALWVAIDSGEDWTPAAMRWWSTCEQLLGETRPELAATLRRLRGYAAPAALEGGLALLREARRVATDTLSRDDPAWGHLGAYLQACGSGFQAYELGVACTEAALECYRRIHPDTHSAVVRATLQLLEQLLRLGRFDEAASLARDQLARIRRLLPPDHWYVAQAHSSLGRALIAKGELAEAEDLILSASERFSVLFGPAHGAHFELALARMELYAAQGREPEAATARREAVRFLARTEWSAVPAMIGDLLSPEAGGMLLALDADEAAGRPPDEQTVERLLALRRGFPDDDPRAAVLAEPLRLRANRARARGAADLAERMFRDVVAVFRACAEGAHPCKLGRALREYALLLTDQGRFDEAEAAAREAYAILLAQRGETYVWTAGARRQLGLALAGRGRYEEAERHLLGAYRAHLARDGTAGTHTHNTFDELVERLYLPWRGPDHAVAFALEELRARLPEPRTSAAWLQRAVAAVVMVPDLEREARALAHAATERCLALEPEAPYLHALLARALVRLDRPDAALAAWSRAAALGREPDAWDHAFMALLHHAAARPADAAAAAARMREHAAELEGEEPLLALLMAEVERAGR